MLDSGKSLLDAAQSIVLRLAGLLGDPEFRSDLRAIARSILEELPEGQEAFSVEKTDRSAGKAEQPAGESSGTELPVLDRREFVESEPAGHPVESKPAPIQARTDDFVPAPAAASQLMPRFNRLSPAPPAPLPIHPQNSDAATAREMMGAGLVVGLANVQQRCRIKADAARWAAERRRLIAAGVEFFSEVEPRDREIIARARQIENCYLWTNNPRGPEPDDLRDFDRLGACFDIVADAIECVRTATENEAVSDGLEYESLQLLAESQSLLRINVHAIGYAMDTDQNDVFKWLREFSSRENVYIERYMRINDVPDPYETLDLQNRVTDLDRRLGEAIQQDKQYRKFLGKVRWESRLVQEHPEQAPNRTRTICEAVEKLVKAGLPPSHIELRDYILPVTEHFEALSEIPDEMVQVLRAVDTFRNRHPSATAGAPEVVAWSDDVESVRERLAGKSVFLIGGELRPQRKAAIEAAFGLGELIWETTVEHSTLDFFYPFIERPEVAVVLLAIRWSSHSYSEIEEACRKFGKPLVRLPGGMHPNQIAFQLMQQASNRL